jgi:BTB/POZ domain
MTAMVHFNVGGTRYEVSGSLLDMHPNTMLARSADELWHEDPESEIFVERNGDRFQYVLDYLRDGRAFLPMGVPKDAFLGDLEYYCLEGVDESKIERKLTCAAQVLHDLRSEIGSWDADFEARKTEKRALEDQMKGLELQQACIVLVKECAARYLKDGDLLLFLTTEAEEDKPAIEAAQKICKCSSPKDALDQCNAYLDKVGLMFASLEATYGAGYEEDFTVRMALVNDEDHDLIEC